NKMNYGNRRANNLLPFNNGLCQATFRVPHRHSPLLVLRVSKRRGSPTNKMNYGNRRANNLLPFNNGLCQATFRVSHRHLP
ncbi:MAG: hypothetical protein ACKO13_12625, partial [Cytophagales bacterium]